MIQTELFQISSLMKFCFLIKLPVSRMSSEGHVIQNSLTGCTLAEMGSRRIKFFSYFLASLPKVGFVKYVGGGGEGGEGRPLAFPPPSTHKYLNLLLLVIRSVTDVLWAQSRVVKFVGIWIWIPLTDLWRWVYLGLKVCHHVTSILRHDWQKLVGGVLRVGIMSENNIVNRNCWLWR